MAINKQEVELMVRLLFDRYGSLVIDPGDVSELTGRSEASLTRDRAEATGIPVTKTGKAKGSDRVKYSIYDIAEYIVDRKTKTKWFKSLFIIL